MVDERHHQTEGGIKDRVSKRGILRVAPVISSYSTPPLPIQSARSYSRKGRNHLECRYSSTTAEPTLCVTGSENRVDTPRKEP